MEIRPWLTIQHTDEEVSWTPRGEDTPYGRLILDDGQRHFSHEPVPELWYDAIHDASEHEQLYLIAAITTENATVPQEPLTPLAEQDYHDTYVRLWAVFESLDYRVHHGHPLEYMASIIDAHIRQTTPYDPFEPVVENTALSSDQLERLTKQTAQRVPTTVIQDIIECSVESPSLPTRAAVKLD